MYARTRAFATRNATMVAPTGLDAARGVGWATLGAGLFALVYLSGRLSGDVASVFQLALLRYAGGSTILLAFALARKDLGKSLRTPRPGTHLVRSICSCAGGPAAIYAATHLPATSASAIGLLDGVLIVLLGAVAFGERMPPRRAIALGGCVTGAAIVVAGSGAGIGIADRHAWRLPRVSAVTLTPC